MVQLFAASLCLCTKYSYFYQNGSQVSENKCLTLLQNVLLQLKSSHEIILEQRNLLQCVTYMTYYTVNNFFPASKFEHNFGHTMNRFKIDD